MGLYFSDTEEGLWSQKYKKCYFIKIVHSINYLIFSYLSTIEAFKDRAQCMIDQYSSYVVKEINMTVLNYTF